MPVGSRLSFPWSQIGGLKDVNSYASYPTGKRVKSGSIEECDVQAHPGLVLLQQSNNASP